MDDQVLDLALMTNYSQSTFFLCGLLLARCRSSNMVLKRTKSFFLFLRYIMYK